MATHGKAMYGMIWCGMVLCEYGIVYPWVYHISSSFAIWLFNIVVEMAHRTI